MSKAEQVLTIEPQNELKFRGPFNVPVTSYMKLSNPSDRKVLFKIKTTAPKKYCVRPNSGLLDPDSHIEIAICLQPFIFDPSEKNKHKFMVQTVFAPPEGEGNVDQLWKDVSIDQMMDSKLKCVFELPAELNVSGQEEAVKVSPKAPLQAATSSATTNESELEKAAVEVQQLREEESSLRQENLHLKEEIFKLKRSTMAQPQLSKYTPTVTQEQSISLLHLALGITLAIFGIILGKFIL